MLIVPCYGRKLSKDLSLARRKMIYTSAYLNALFLLTTVAY